MNFGLHLMLDGYRGSQGALGDLDAVSDFLHTAVEICGMNIMHGPIIKEAKGVSERDKGGWSGFVLVQESHISIHTFPKRGFVSIDCYTCKGSLPSKVIARLAEGLFSLASFDLKIVKRGLRFPLKDL